MQRILIFQQKGSGEKKTAGIKKYGRGLFELQSVSINTPLAALLDDTDKFLPEVIQADLVLDFLKHPDLSHDLAIRCRKLGVPVVASGKKIPVEGVLTPPT
jgi:hypothetical protein